jgi:hypothetical protein
MSQNIDHFKIQPLPPPKKKTKKKQNKQKIQYWSHRIILVHFVFKLYPETAVMYMAGMMSIRFFPIRVMRKDLTFGVILGQMEIYGR